MENMLNGDIRYSNWQLMNLSAIFQSNEPPETITVSSFAQKFRPRNMAPYMTPPRYSTDASSPKLSSDPLLTGSPVMKTKSIPSDGTVGGFPVKFLDMVVCPELTSDVDNLWDIYAVCVCVYGGSGGVIL